MQPSQWFINLTGSIAAVCTTLAFVPQFVRVYRLRTARDISLITFLAFSVGVFLWLLYGLFIRSLPVICANGATLVLALAILFLKLIYGRD